MERKLRLSPKGILRFGILLALTLYLWNFFRGYFLFLALIIMLCAPAVSFLLLWSARGALGVRAVLPENRTGRNTEIPFAVLAYNPRKFSAFTAEVVYSVTNLFTGCAERKKERLWLAPRNGGGIRQTVSSRYAGRLEIRIEEFVVFDLFHLFCLRGCDRTGACTVVWPGFTEENEEEISSCVEDFPQESEIRKRGMADNPDYEVREYIPGDAPKTIHWKLSARQEKLMVRERLAAGREKINVLLPLGEEKQQNDELVDAAYALCRLLLRREYPLLLCWPGQGGNLRDQFMTEQGELEKAFDEILSSRGSFHPEEVKAQMAVQHPEESCIVIRTGAYKGAYIR